MGISRASDHKRRATGGRLIPLRKGRKFHMGRQPALTKIGPKRIRDVRGRGGNIKKRALRLEGGNFAWPSETTTRKARILDVVYNASNNELVRTKTLVKGSIIQIDGTQFRLWYEQHYGTELGRKKDGEVVAPKKQSKAVLKKLAARGKDRYIDPALAEQFVSGRLYAKITSRPGQSGRCDGYILEGAELQFYLKKISKKK